MHLEAGRPQHFSFSVSHPKSVVVRLEAVERKLARKHEGFHGGLVCREGPAQADFHASHLLRVAPRHPNFLVLRETPYVRARAHCTTQPETNCAPRKPGA